MENLCKGLMWGFALGMVVGGIAVAKNKKLANKIKSGLSGASEKFEEAKEMIEEKIEEAQQMQEQNQSQNSSGNKEMNKKSKN